MPRPYALFQASPINAADKNGSDRSFGNCPRRLFLQGLFEDAQTKAFEDSIKKNYTGKSNGDGYCSATACGFRPSSHFKVVIPTITIKNDTPGGF